MVAILSLNFGHDAAAALFDDYKIVAAVQKERLTRRKKDTGLVMNCVDEVLSIGGMTRDDIGVVVLSRDMFPTEFFRQSLFRRLHGKLNGRLLPAYQTVNKALRKARSYEPRDVLDVDAVLRVHGLRPDIDVVFTNHHYTHALPSLFFTDWGDALLYTADGAGDNVNYSQRIFRDEKLTCLFGDDRWLHQPYRHDGMGRAYACITGFLGFRPVHHEGKVTGLAAFGEPVLRDKFLEHFRVLDSGEIVSDFTNEDEFQAHFTEPSAGHRREDVAASIQAFTEDMLVTSIQRILEREKVKRIGLAGGVFANVKVNQRIAESCNVSEVFVVPPMGDDGLVIGGALQYLLERDGMKRWLSMRYRLNDVYWGRGYGRDTARRFLAHNPGIYRVPGEAAETASRLIAEGKAVATFSRRMEFGPRALGARSIMASPERRDINDSLNKRLDRSEFMPFAPVVTEEDASRVFNVTGVNAYACRFMTITCDVKQEWRERIPAVVHVDGTARPQIIRRQDNALYYDILKGFTARTGFPVTINTSFNVHEEPIINTPEEAAQALIDDRVDYLVTEDGVFGHHP